MKNQLPNSLLYLLSVSAGLVVANLYYNQPLLHDIALSLNVSDSKVSNVALSTQIGYALGLLFIIPLGDKVNNLKIIRINFFNSGAITFGSGPFAVFILINIQ